MKILKMKERLWVILIVTIIIIKMAQGAKIQFVGGSFDTWAPNKVNLSEWSTHEEFYVGEWLFFGTDNNKYNALEVNKTNYENCIDTDFISNVTKVLWKGVMQELTEPRMYYFLSGKGFCSQGVKVAIQAVNPSPPPAPPVPQNPPASDSASASSGGLGFNDDNGISQMLLLPAFVWSFFFGH